MKDMSVPRHRLTEFGKLNTKAVEAKIKGELSQEDFQAFKESNGQEKQKVIAEIKSLESELEMKKSLSASTASSEFEVLDHGEEYADPNVRFELVQTNPQKSKLVQTWEKRNVLGKQELQLALYPVVCYGIVKMAF